MAERKTAKTPRRRSLYSWTLARLASRCGITEQYACMIRRGARTPSLATIRKLATACNMTVGEMIAHLDELKQNRRGASSST